MGRSRRWMCGLRYGRSLRPWESLAYRRRAGFGEPCRAHFGAFRFRCPFDWTRIGWSRFAKIRSAVEAMPGWDACVSRWRHCGPPLRFRRVLKQPFKGIFPARWCRGDCSGLPFAAGQQIFPARAFAESRRSFLCLFAGNARAIREGALPHLGAHFLTRRTEVAVLGPMQVGPRVQRGDVVGLLGGVGVPGVLVRLHGVITLGLQQDRCSLIDCRGGRRVAGRRDPAVQRFPRQQHVAVVVISPARHRHPIAGKLFAFAST